MPILTVEISRFTDEYQPGFVECKLVDAFGQLHFFNEKVPVVSAEDLWSSSKYPCVGGIECTVEAEWQDESGRHLKRVSTERPWSVESTTGTTTFVVQSSQLTED
jgi:hypothetical protein